MNATGIVKDFVDLGFIPRQVFAPEDEWPIGERPVTYSMRITRNQELHPEAPLLPADPVDVTVGDDLGWHLWEKDTRQCSSWFGGPAASVVTSVPKGGLVSLANDTNAPQLLPLRQIEAGELVTDDGYQEQTADLPDWSGWWPKGWLGLRSAGTEHQSQETAWHPSFMGLVSVNKAGNPKVGTRVFDVDAESAVDNWAPLQSLVSVHHLGDRASDGYCGINGRALALQLGKGGNLDGGAGHLPFVDWGKQEVGFGSSVAGGPFTTGGAGCVHSVNTDRDGNKLRPLHFSTDALFILEGGAAETSSRPTTGGTSTETSSPGTRERGAGTRARSSEARDAPLAFERETWRRPRPGGPHWVRTHLRFDDSQSHPTPCGSYAGKWAWETPQAFYIPDPGGEGNGLVLEDPNGSPVPRGPGVITGGTTSEGYDYGHVDGTAPVVGQGGYRPAYVHATNCVVTSGQGFKATPTATGSPSLGGSTVVSDDDRVNWEGWPLVGMCGSYGKGTGSVDGWDATPGTALTYPTSSGGVVFHPGDVDLVDVVTGDAASDHKLYVVLPTSMCGLGLGSPHQQSGGVADGFTIETNTDGDLLFQSMDADGLVTATATLSHGATSFGSGSGDVSGPGSSTATQIPVFADGTGKAISASSVQIDNGNIEQAAGIAMLSAAGSPHGGLYGLYVDNGTNAINNEGLVYDNGGTLGQVVTVDPSATTANYVVAINGSNNGFTLVDPTTITGNLDDLGDVTITSVSNGDYMRRTGGVWVNTPEINAANDPGGVGAFFPAHYLENDHASSSARDSVVLEIAVTANTFNFSGHGTALAFTGATGTRLGNVVGVRSGSSTGYMVIQPSTGADVFAVKDQSAQSWVTVNGTGIICIEDTLTSGSPAPEGSTHLTLFARSGDLWVTPAGGTAQQITGSGSVQSNLNNSDSVVTGVTSDGETYVYSSGDGGLVAADLYAPPSNQDFTVSGTGKLITGASGCLQLGSTNVQAGTGTPESNVSGNKGDIFLRTDGGAGTCLYVKETTGGNTGWVAK